MALVHLPNLIDIGYAHNCTPAATAAVAKGLGFVVSEQIVRNAYMDIANQQWLDMNNGNWEPSADIIPF